MSVASHRQGRMFPCPMALLLLTLTVVTSAAAYWPTQDIWSGFRFPDSTVSHVMDIAMWRTITFDFEGNTTREQQYRNWGSYDPITIFLIDAEQINGNLYVTNPPFKPGTPASFNVLTSTQTLDPPVRPFPSWEAHATTRHALTDCSKQMVSVFRATRVLYDYSTVYLIDSGRVNIASTFEQLCPPKIVTLNMSSGTILNTLEIDKVDCTSLYIAMQVEETSDGKRVAYSADVTGFALAVTDLSTGQTHRVRSQHYFPAPGLGITTINGVRSYLMDGLFALGLANGYMYSWAFASNTLNKVATRILRNASDNQILDLTVETLVPGHRAGPAGAMALDLPGRRMFFGMAEQTALYCWDTRKPYEQRRFRLLDQDPERFQFFSSVKMLPSNERILIATDRYHKFAQDIFDQQSVNYRVMSMNIRNLTC